MRFVMSYVGTFVVGRGAAKLHARPIILLAAALGASVPVGSATADDLSSGTSIAAFTEEAIQRGLVYQMAGYPQPYGYSGFGITFADLNQSGAQDLLLMGNATRSMGIFENDGQGFFQDRSADANLPIFPSGSSVVVGDFSGNGYPDLYVVELGNPNWLFRNDGDLQFTDVTAEAGVGDAGAGKSAIWGDYNNNGWLDLYVCNYDGIIGGTGQLHNRLYRNQGDGTFEDVTVEQNLTQYALSFQAVFFDMNRNGFLDLYVSNDRGALISFPGNLLYTNINGNFEDVSESSGAGVELFSMGLACGDLNGNGFPDLYMTNIAGYENGYNPLLINQGDGTFVEASVEAGIDHWKTSWGSVFFDFTNNGWLDLFVNNQFLPNTLYYHPGQFPMQDVTSQAQVAGNTGPSQISYSSAVADVTGNGALDLVTNDFNSHVRLYINNEGIKRNSIRFRVKGTFPNLHAVGANVDTRIGDQWQYREIYAGGNSYISQNELIVHVGTGDATHADEIVVTWPGQSATRTLTNYPANHLWNIYHPDHLGDGTGSGSIGVFDLLGMLGAWGPIQPGAEVYDMNGDGVIDVFDLLALLSRWG